MDQGLGKIRSSIAITLFRWRRRIGSSSMPVSSEEGAGWGFFEALRDRLEGRRNTERILVTQVTADRELQLIRASASRPYKGRTSAGSRLHSLAMPCIASTASEDT